jgi:DNA polymerase V
MINIGIFPKGLLIVDRSRDPIDGDIVIAVLDGELTVKRLEKCGHRVALVAENKKFPPIVVREDCSGQVKLATFLYSSQNCFSA